MLESTSSSSSRRSYFNYGSRYNSNNNSNNRNMKPWQRHNNGSRSPSLSSNGDWQEDDDSMARKSFVSNSNSSSITTTVGSSSSRGAAEEPPVISLVEYQNHLDSSIKPEENSFNSTLNNGASGGGPSSGGGRQYSSYETGDCKEDKKNYHQHHQNYQQHRNNNQNQNYSSGGYGQYNNNNYNGKRSNLNHRQQYGNNNGYGGYQQRRQYNNNFNYNNFRNYGNNRRQFPPHNDFYHNNQQHYNNNNQHQNGNDGYYNRGGPRGYSDSYHGYHRNESNSGGNTPLSSPEFEDYLPWPAKRGCGTDENYYGNGNYYGANSRNCSPDTSPTSDISGSFPTTGQTRDIVLNNGSVITAQNLGPYEYFVGNIQNQNNGFQYPSYSGNYFYGCATDRESNSESIALMGPPPPPPSISNSSSRAESCTDSPAAEKMTDWPDDSTDSDSEGPGTAASTRSQTPEEFTDMTVSNDASFRFFDNFTAMGKDFSPTSFYLGLHKRGRLPFPREWFEDLEPDEVIKQFSKVVDTKEKPFSFTVESAFTVLDISIWTKFVENHQTVDTFRKKVELWRDVYRLVRFMNFTPEFKHDTRNFPFFGLQVVGSTMSGFGSNSSDVDMCLVIRDTEVDQRFEAVERLQALSQTLNSLPFVENVEMIYAKVPILKFRDSSRRLDVDLNCNNFIGIRNTHLLYAYAQMDWRLKPLVLIVKLWAQFHGINDAKMMTISSYSLVLMVIHFLQHGLENPVLPNLQQEYPEKFSNTVSILSVKIHEEMPAWTSKNMMGLGELLILFLEYYSRKFDYSRHVISVRTGGTISMKLAAHFKSPKNDFHQWKLLCIEEPFDRTNTARSVYDRAIFDKIIAIFYASWQRLLVSQLLDSIFTPFSEEDLRAIVAIRLR